MNYLMSFVVSFDISLRLPFGLALVYYIDFIQTTLAKVSHVSVIFLTRFNCSTSL